MWLSMSSTAFCILIMSTVTSVAGRGSNVGPYFSRVQGEFSLDAVLMNTAEVIIGTLQGPVCENKVSYAGLGRILCALQHFQDKSSLGWQSQSNFVRL